MTKVNDRYKDIKKLEDTFIKLGGDRKIVGLSLIDELYFMGEALFELKDIARKSNYIERFEQGAQNFKREHPAMKSYNTTIKNFNSTIKQLNDLLPDDSNKKAGESLLAFASED